MSKSSFLLGLSGIVLVGALSSGCWGEEPTPVTEPVAEPEPAAAADTAAPAAQEEDEEAMKRREFFEKWQEAGAPPETQEEAVADAEEPETEPEPEPPPVVETRPVAPTPPPPKRPTVVTRPAPVPPPKPTTVRTELGTQAPSTATRPAPSTTTRPTPAVSPRSPEPAVAIADLPPQEDYLGACGDSISMRMSARKGELFEAEIQCLEAVFSRAPSSLDREAISVLLLSNAYATDDKRGQEELLARHLKEVDGSNPEMNYRYALLLMAKGPEHSSTVMDLTNVALTHRAVWTGEAYEKRVYSLYKLRAAAAKYELEKAEEAYAEGQSDEAERAVYRAREATKKYAREWYAYAKETGQDTVAARELCLISARSSRWCEGL